MTIFTKIYELIITLVVVIAVGTNFVGCADSSRKNAGAASSSPSGPTSPPNPAVGLHFQDLYNSINTAKYLTYDLRIAQINQGDSSTVGQTPHGFVLVEYLGQVDANNLHVRFYWFLTNGVFAEDNTVMPTDDPHMQVNYDQIGQSQGGGRGPDAYYPLKLERLNTNQDYFVTETKRFPTKGKYFVSPVRVMDPKVGNDYFDGKNFDSAHDPDKGDMLGFWFVNGSFYSLHDKTAPAPLQ